MDFSIFQHQKATPKRVAFLFPKLLKIIPKAVLTRTKSGSFIGQVIFENNLTNKGTLVGSRSNRFWMDLKKFR